MTVPVLIVGAGPTGLTLGCDLARRGIRCLLVDRGLFGGSRAKGLQPRTLEVFDDLGVADTIRAEGAPFPPFRLYVGDQLKWERTLEEMLGAQEPPPATAHPRAWLIPQWRTDQILLDRFTALGGEARFDTALVGFTADAHGVTATLDTGEEVRADWLVGADGGHSTVRKAGGFRFDGESDTSEHTWIGDVGVDGIDGVACHIFTSEGDVTRRFSLWNLPGTHLFQFVASMGRDDAPEPTLDAVQRLLDQRSGRTDLRLYDLRWVSLYRVSVRCVDRMRIGRVLLAGDAAHVHSSAGGQGLNTSVQDAYNLGWKLARVVAGGDPALLDTYDTERLAVAAQVIGRTQALHRQNFRPSTGETPALHQLDVTYRGGPLAVDERDEPGVLRAGDRAPDVLLPDGSRLYTHLPRGEYALLKFGDAADGALRLDPLPDYDRMDGCFVLIRPDRHIAVISPIRPNPV